MTADAYQACVLAKPRARRVDAAGFGRDMMRHYTVASL